MEVNKKLLSTLVDIISVSQSKYQDAKNRYNSLSDWINRKESVIANDSPHIYTHGSFLLGTAVNPLRGEEFDLDIMCCLRKFNALNISQSDLKNKVGDEIIAYAESHGMEKPEDKTRAWTINYSEKSQFHMDIMPSIPSGNGEIVYIPFKDSGFYNQVLSPWEKSSNPKGYLNWFRSISKDNYHKKLENFAVTRNVKIEEIPKYSVKSTLQEVVILLKRHRDVFFENLDEKFTINNAMMKKEKVASIIITTLSGMAYKQEENITEAFFGVVDRIEDYIQVRDFNEYSNFKYTEDFIIGNKSFRITNPSNTDEDFTDKWRENPYKKMAFFAWLKQLKQDTEKLKIIIYGHASKMEIVYKMFGENIKNNFYDFLTEDIDRNEILYLEKPPYNKNISTIISISAYASSIKLENYDTPDLFKYLIKSNQELKKNTQLLFVANVNNILQQPYEIWWQVSNKGRESVVKDQIRGEFSKSAYYHKNYSYRYQKSESTQYTGTHWIKGYIIKNEMIIAESSKFYVKVV